MDPQQPAQLLDVVVGDEGQLTELIVSRGSALRVAESSAANDRPGATTFAGLPGGVLTSLTFSASSLPRRAASGSHSA